VLGLQAIGMGGASSLRATIRDSTVVGNVSDGVLASNSGAQLVQVSLDRVTAVNNAGTAVHADGTHAVIILADSSLNHNGSGIGATNGGQVISYGDNINLISGPSLPTSVFTPF